jgi:hypothetical protein
MCANIRQFDQGNGQWGVSLPAVRNKCKVSHWLAAVFAMLSLQAYGQITCVTCPTGAAAASVSVAINVTRASDGTTVNPGIPVSAGDQLVLQGLLSYQPFVFPGVTGAAFYGGQALISAYPGQSAGGSPEMMTDVTPTALASTVIGPGTDCSNGSPTVSSLPMNTLAYTFTPADIAAGVNV